MEISFELKAASNPTLPVLIVAGGADADQNKKVDHGEVATFSRTNNTWSRKQVVQDPTTGMLFGVTMTLGVGIQWALTITGAGATLHSSSGTTAFNSETVSGFLK